MPADLNGLAGFNKHRHHALATGCCAHACEGGGVEFDVVFLKFATAPFQPFTYFPGVWAFDGAVELSWHIGNFVLPAYSDWSARLVVC